MNNTTFNTGDIVRVSDAYFTTSNGLFFVSDGNDSPNRRSGGIYLRRLNKSGKLSADGAKSSESWPLHSYCSDSRKNHEANAHNEQHAKIERVEGVNTWYVAEYFRERAEEHMTRVEYNTEHGNEDRANEYKRLVDFYNAVADRLAASAEQPKENAPETGIKFYWNGIKVNGGKLIPCYYSVNSDKDTPRVHISAKNYGAELPREYFTVTNDSDIMTDYFDTDSTVLTPEHPLYKYARYVALKSDSKHNEKRLAYIENELNSGRREPWRGHYDSLRTEAEGLRRRLDEWKNAKDPGQPTADDLKAVADMKTAAESARLAKEHAEQLAERERFLRERNEGRHFIEQTAQQHPISEGAPVVTIKWSEHPAFSSWSDDALKLSVAAAEIVLSHFDTQQHETRDTPEGHGWYYKTAFCIEYKDPKTGVQNTYEGRYDLGDGEGGMIAHIRNFARYCEKDGPFHDTEQAAEIQALADYLEQFTANGRVISVELAPWIKELAQQKREQARQEADDILDTVELLTDEQLEAAVFAVKHGTEHADDIARFFLQELARRDKSKALEVWKRWKASA